MPKKILFIPKKKWIIPGLFLALALLLAPQFTFAVGFLDGVVGVGNVTLAVVSKLIASLVALVTYFFGYTLIPIASSILNWSFNLSNITHVPLVETGWTITRDLVNMLFVLIFLIIAFATIMRFESYGSKALLTRFILAALLINFSLFFGGIFIDIGNDLGKFFTTGGSETSAIDVGANMMNALGMSKLLNDQNRNTLQTDENASTEFAVLVSAIFTLIMIMVVAFLFGFIALLLVFRMVALWILLILAPIAWICIILPGTRSIWSKWWNQFLSWSFLPAVIGFFIYLGVLAAGSFTDATFAVYGGGDSYVTQEFRGSFPFGANIRHILQYIAVLIILWFGVIVGKSWSATGSELLFKGADGAKNWALGRVKAGGVWAGKTAGGTALNVAAPESFRRRVRENIERAPVFGRMIGGPGARYQQRRGWIEEAKKGMSDDENDLRNIISQKVTTDAGRARRAAAIEKLTETGKLRDQDFNVKHLKDLEWAGGDIEKVVQQRPDWAMDHTVQELLANYRKTKFDWEPILKINPNETYKDPVTGAEENDLATGRLKTKRDKVAEELLINETLPKKAGDIGTVSKRFFITWEEYDRGLKKHKGNNLETEKLHRRWNMTQRWIHDFQENVDTFDVGAQGNLIPVSRSGYYGPQHAGAQSSQNPQAWTKVISEGNLMVRGPDDRLYVREGIPQGTKVRILLKPGGGGNQARAAAEQLGHVMAEPGTQPRADYTVSPPEPGQTPEQAREERARGPEEE